MLNEQCFIINTDKCDTAALMTLGLLDHRYNDRFSLSHQICEKLSYIYFTNKLKRILLNASKKKSDEIDKN